MPPLTTQLPSAQSRARTIDPGPQGNGAATLIQGLGGLAQTLVGANQQAGQNARAERADARAEQSSEFEADREEDRVEDRERAEFTRGLANEYTEARNMFQSRLEQDGDRGAYRLSIRNLRTRMMAENPGFEEDIRAHAGVLGDDPDAFSEQQLMRGEQAALVEGQSAAIQANIQVARNQGMDPTQHPPTEMAQYGANMSASLRELEMATARREAIESSLDASQEEWDLAQDEYQVDVYAAMSGAVRDQFAPVLDLMGSLTGSIDLTDEGQVAVYNDVVASAERSIMARQSSALSLIGELGLEGDRRTAVIAQMDTEIANIRSLYQGDNDILERRQRLYEFAGQQPGLRYGEQFAMYVYLKDTFGEDFFATQGVMPELHPSILEDALEALRVPTGEVAQSQMRVESIMPALTGGSFNIMDIDDPQDALRASRQIEASLDANTTQINQSGGAPHANTVESFNGNLIALSSAAQQIGIGGTEKSVVRHLTGNIASSDTTAAIHTIMADPTQAERGGQVVEATRSSVENLRNITNNHIEEFNNAWMARGVEITLDSSGRYSLQQDARGAARRIGGVQNITGFGEASRYTEGQRLVDTANSQIAFLVDTDRYSDRAALTEASEASRATLWATQDLSRPLVDDSGEPVTPLITAGQEARTEALGGQEVTDLALEMALQAFESSSTEASTSPEFQAVRAEFERMRSARGAQTQEVQTLAAEQNALQDEIFSPTPDTDVRGIRNNNPGNIEQGNAEWDGLSSDQSGDDRFATFDTPEHGIRAMARTLDTYQSTHGLNTIEDIIGRWAPAVENDTAGYAAFVAGEAGVDVDAEVDLTDESTLTAIVTAMIQMENGEQPYEEETIRRGVRMAKQEEGAG